MQTLNETSHRGIFLLIMHRTKLKHKHIHASPAYLEARSLERNEPRRVGGTDTRATVLDGLVRDGELGKVVADHLGLDFDLRELLAVVDTDHRPDHLGDDDHVAQVRLDDGRLLVRRRRLLGRTQTLNKTHRLGHVLAARVATASTGGEQLEELKRRKK